MNNTSTKLAGIKLKADRPTKATFAALSDWVIWQFPQQEKKGYRGAVKPPLSDHAWFPAIILPHKQRVQIYAHVDATYSSPEQAMAFFSSNLNQPR